jgi:hypothetical protein
MWRAWPNCCAVVWHGHHALLGESPLRQLWGVRDMACLISGYSGPFPSFCTYPAAQGNHNHIPHTRGRCDASDVHIPVHSHYLYVVCKLKAKIWLPLCCMMLRYIFVVRLDIVFNGL